MFKEPTNRSYLAFAFLKCAQYGANTALATAVTTTGLALWAQPELQNGIVITAAASALSAAVGGLVGLSVGAHRASKMLAQSLTPAS